MEEKHSSGRWKRDREGELNESGKEGECQKNIK